MNEPTRAGKFLAYVLRHAPARSDLAMERTGWVDVAALLAACNANGHPLTPALLASLAAQDARRRCDVSGEGQKIAGSQGDSAPGGLGYAPAEPPAILYHGAADRFLETILREGLQKSQRLHIHLAPDAGAALAEGQGPGAPIVLLVDAGRLYRDGGIFYLSVNGVWLTDRVPPEYLAVLAPPSSNSA